MLGYQFVAVVIHYHYDGPSSIVIDFFVNQQQSILFSCEFDCYRLLISIDDNHRLIVTIDKFPLMISLD